ncbi:MAG: hypothetical protein U0599_23820 [Vicinamibacteria bacterium]
MAGVRGGERLGPERLRPEQADDRVLRPLPSRRPLGHVEDRVPGREALDGLGEDGGERLEDALAAHGDRRDRLRVAGVQGAVELVHAQHLRQVALVVLEHERHRLGIEVMRQEVLRHLPVALDVLVPPVESGVRDEHQRVGALQHEPPRRRVHGLTGHREHLKAQLEATVAGGLERQQVEQDRAVLRGVDRDHLAAAARVGRAVEDLQVRGLPADGRAVVDQLDLDQAIAVVELDHFLGPGSGGVYRTTGASEGRGRGEPGRPRRQRRPGGPGPQARYRGEDVGSATGIRTPV